MDNMNVQFDIGAAIQYLDTEVKQVTASLNALGAESPIIEVKAVDSKLVHLSQTVDAIRSALKFQVRLRNGRG